MRVNIVEKGGVLIIEDALFRTLKEIYAGNGIWLDVDEISMDFGASDKADDPVIAIKVEYGRQDDGSEMNFRSNFEVSLNEREVDLQFLCGMFFHHLNTEEVKFYGQIAQ